MSRASIRQRVEAAWPGPWWTKHAPDPAYEADWPIVAAPDTFLVTPGIVRQPDAAFIAAARTDIPLLLAVADAAAALMAHHGDTECMASDDRPWPHECEAAHEPLRAALAALEAQP